MFSGPSSTGNVEKPEIGSVKKSNAPKGKKRKKPVRDQTAPRQPLTGIITHLLSVTSLFLR